MAETALTPQYLEASNMRYRLKRPVKIAFIGIGIFLAVMFIEHQWRNRPLGNIHIKILAPEGQYFLDSTEVKRLLTDNSRDNITVRNFASLSIKTLEARVKSNLFVDKCEIARNLQGDLFVEIVQAQPIARFVRQGKPDFYADSTGKIMPTSAKYSARVLLVSYNGTDRPLPDFKQRDRALLELLNAVYRDKFWRAQICQLDINERDEITMLAQMGNQSVEFGRAEDITDKLHRLRIFYHEVLSRKGWTAYKRVSLQYTRQIVCE